MTSSYRAVENWADYTFGCPEGAWTARLDNKAWGKAQNLILYLSEVGTDRKFWLSVFAQNGYEARDGSLSFRDLETGTLLDLVTSKSKAGHPKLETAKITAGTVSRSSAITFGPC